MALARTCVYHGIGTDLRHLVGSMVDRGGSCGVTPERLERRFADYVGARHCRAFATARAAVFHALRTRRFPPGSEIVMSPITIHGMIDAVVAAGLRPVFVDVDPETLVFDPELLRRACSDRTRAVMITYLFGLAVDPRELISVCRQHRLFVVEDFSHSLGCAVEGQRLGTFGDLGVYSCSATKTLDAYGGGLAVTNSTELDRHLREEQLNLRPPPRHRLPVKVVRTLLLNMAFTRGPFTLVVFPLIRLLGRWAPRVAAAVPTVEPRSRRNVGLPAGAFEQLTRRQARVGLRQLRLVPSTDVLRRTNARDVRATLGAHGIATPAGSPGAVGVDWQTVALVDDPESFKRSMAASGVDVATTKLSLLPELLGPTAATDVPVAHRIKYHAMYVPTHSGLTPADRHRVTTALGTAALRPERNPGA